MASPPSDVPGAPEDSIDFAISPPKPQDASLEPVQPPQEGEFSHGDVLPLASHIVL